MISMVTVAWGIALAGIFFATAAILTKPSDVYYSIPILLLAIFFLIDGRSTDILKAIRSKKDVE